MDYRSQIKEKMGKLLFLEMNIKGFKESIGIPEYVEFKNKDLYDTMVDTLKTLVSTFNPL